MKRIFQWIALAAIISTLSSCGLPGAAVRSTGRLMQSTSGLLNQAM